MSDLGYSEEYTESQTRLEETFLREKETESQTVAGSSSQDTGSLLTERKRYFCS